jgi:tRNA U54 and U55 pseudouridine synthase Pus10
MTLYLSNMFKKPRNAYREWIRGRPCSYGRKVKLSDTVSVSSRGSGRVDAEPCVVCQAGTRRIEAIFDRLLVFLRVEFIKSFDVMTYL